MSDRLHGSPSRAWLTAAALALLLGAARCDEPAPAGSALEFDTTGLGPFWAAHDVLAADREPGDAMWDAMWATPGYALLDAKERRRPALTQAMRLAFRPSLRAAGDTVSGWLAWVLPHLRDVPSSRDSVAAVLDTIRKQGWMEQAIERAQRYLPAGVTTRAPRPEASLIYFIDARGYPERLLLDPLYFLRLSNPIEVLAHEFHHNYRSHIARHGGYGDDLLAWVLSTVESEGVPGLLDKADVPGLTAVELAAKYPDPQLRAYFETYQLEYAKPDHRLRQAESVLERVALHPDSTVLLGRWLHRELPDNGRILGAFMATAIERVLGLDRLVETVGDPFAFFRAYAEAAARDATLPRGLSPAAHRVLDAIDARYRIGAAPPDSAR